MSPYKLSSSGNLLPGAEISRAEGNCNNCNTQVMANRLHLNYIYTSITKNIRNVTRQEWPKRKKQANKMGMAVVNFHHAYS